MTAAVNRAAAPAAPSMVDRITAIVDVLDGPAGLSLDSIAARARLPRSTTHRILDHLVRLDWVTHSGRGYSLGRRAMSWGAANAGDLRLRSAAAPVLCQLQTRTSAVVHLGVLDRGHVVHLDKLDDRTGVTHVPSHVGSRALAHRTGLGVAVLSVLTPEDVMDHLHDVNAIDTLGGELGFELHRTRRNGFAYRIGDYGAALASVSAPINSRAALGVVVPADVSAEPYKPLVRAAAARVQQCLRYAANR
jgi:DNA-binding IclR family transcriptional regulator